MKNKYKIWTSIFCAIFFVATLLCYTSYAWFTHGDNLGRSVYSIVKLNSTVTLFKGIDSNFNGIADLCDTEDECTTTYYKETHKFEQIGDVDYAISTRPTTNLDVSIEVDDMLPGRISTHKFALINLGETDTTISVAMDQITRSDYSDKQWDLLSTLSIRVVSIREGENEVPVYAFLDKIYLCDYLNSGGEITISSNETIGDIFNSANFGNCYDFLFWVEMEPFEELSTHENFGISDQATFNALADGTQIVLPLITLTFTITYQD